MTSPERQEVAARIAAAGGDGALALANAVRELEALRARIAEMGDEAQERNARLLYLEGLIDTPETADFLEGVKREVAHQRKRWGTGHDAGKTDADWFWLVGYLAGKALHKPEKRLHHLITTAAALANWHHFEQRKAVP